MDTIKYRIQPTGKTYFLEFNVDREKVETVKNIFTIVPHITNTYNLPMYDGFDFLLNGQIQISLDINENKCVVLTAKQVVPDTLLDTVSASNLLQLPELEKNVDYIFNTIINMWKKNALTLFKQHLTMH